jgi:putative endopeptidase
MYAHSINAYYSPNYNEIVIPAGILQEPFYYEEDNIGENFAGIGMVIGHEIIHGFDDHGRLYDYKGNYNNWWTNNDIILYNKKIQELKNQFQSYTIMNEIINVNLTIGENIADLGGIKYSLLSLLQIIKNNPLKKKIIKNFFYNYANIWAYNIRYDKLKKNNLIDPHLPYNIRVNGIIKNINIFYKIFNINSGDMFIPENERISIW